MSELPIDLSDFLAKGSQLDFDPEGTSIGSIRLKSLQQVSLTTLTTFAGCQSIVNDPYESLDGRYEVPVYDLIAESDEYEPQGCFCWLPTLKAYGSIDTEHGDILIVPDVTWSMIVADPVPYLDAQWERAGLGRRIFPWLHFPFRLDDDSVILPYPAECSLHRLAIAPHAQARHKLFDVFRDQDVAAWFSASRERFPFSGVPADEDRLLSCPTCFAYEAHWLQDIDDSILVQDATKNAGGFVLCPRCGIRFSPADKARFVDGVHLTCGQRINVLEHRIAGQ